jgi:3-phosphoshikimate 1-carboxyvinyltransferase
MIELKEGVALIKSPDSLSGEVKIPGDKSISHRAVMLGGLADGTTRINNLAPGEDVQSTVSCIRQLGVEIEEGDDEVLVKGNGHDGLGKPDRRLDAGNSGTLTRLLTGMLASLPNEAEIDGDESLRSRPMERIIEPLEFMGAEIDSRDGNLPLQISGGDLKGIEYQPEVASAQVKSSILLAGLRASGSTTVDEVGPSRDHTERILDAMGYPIRVNGREVTVDGGGELSPISIDVPGDFSSASYLIAAGLINDNSRIKLKSVGLNETRTGFLDLLERMGGDIEVKNRRTGNGEPRGDLLVSSSDLKGVDLNESEVVRAIDELPLLGVVATQAEGKTTLRNAEELRVKETDRISATVSNLEELGADVEEFEDGFTVRGKTHLSGGNLQSHRDHRIAMSAAVGAMAAAGESRLVNPEWVEVSFPDFFAVLEELASE